jgi:hypothetical protein
MSDVPHRCDGCLWWDPEPDDSYRAVAGIGQCRRAVHIWDATEWSNPDEEYDCPRVVKPEYRDVMLFCADASDYRAEVWTRADFFCAHFKPRGAGDR